MSQNWYQTIHNSINEHLESVFARTPDQRVMTYKDLSHLVASISFYLKKRGLKPYDRVMVKAEKSLEAVALYLACLKDGYTYVPLNVSYTIEELEYFIEDCTPSLLICDREGESQLEPYHDAVLSMEKLNESICESEADSSVTHMLKDDPAVIIYTSGTTGRSKGAVVSHENLATNAQDLLDVWQWSASDCLLHSLPIFHVHGLFVALHITLISGASVIWLDKFDAQLCLDNLEFCTTMMGVPTYYTRLLQSDRLNADLCKNMRLFISGSAPLQLETHHEFEARTGHRILERYGMSEAGIICSNPLSASVRVPGSVGFLLAQTQGRVVDSSGSELGEGEIGELEISGPNVIKKYWNQEEATRKSFTEDGYFKTGDLVQRSHDGRISIVGRSKDLIISGGLNVYPKEVELVLNQIPGVIESAVVGIADHDFGEKVVAVVILEPQRTCPEAEISLQLENQLAKFKVPKQLFFWDSLPRNTMGKIQKHVIRTRLQN